MAAERCGDGWVVPRKVRLMPSSLILCPPRCAFDPFLLLPPHVITCREKEKVRTIMHMCLQTDDLHMDSQFNLFPRCNLLCDSFGILCS